MSQKLEPLFPNISIQCLKIQKKFLKIPGKSINIFPKLLKICQDFFEIFPEFLTKISCDSELKFSRNFFAIFSMIIVMFVYNQVILIKIFANFRKISLNFI